MPITADDRDRTCPACDSATPGEWDPVLCVFYCSTCSATWRRRPGRLVPRQEQPILPGTVPPLDVEQSEWPD